MLLTNVRRYHVWLVLLFFGDDGTRLGIILLRVILAESAEGENILEVPISTGIGK